MQRLQKPVAVRAKKRRHTEDDFDIVAALGGRLSLISSPETLSRFLAGRRQRRARFPKGKTAKRGGEQLPVDGDGGDDLDNWMDPQFAAKERAKRRNRTREDELFGAQEDLSSAEVQYENNDNVEDDGIRTEPFNLKQDTEEGYFDANGNFVEIC